MNLIIKIICSLVPFKSLKRRLKNYLNGMFIYRKDIEKVKQMYPNSIYLISPHAGIGEFSQSICLLKELQKQQDFPIVVITRRKIEADICNLFSSGIKCYFNPDFKYEVKIEKYLPKKLKPGCFYPLYQRAYVGATKRKYAMEFMRDYYNLNQNASVEKIIPQYPVKSDENFENLRQLFEEKKCIFIFPDANTYDSDVISTNDWIKIATFLKDKGYTCVFNSSTEYNGFLNIVLPVDQTIYLANLAYGIIAFRSGFSELLSLSVQKRIVAIYPNGKTNLFKKSWNYSIEKFEKKIKKCPFIFDDNYSLTINSLISSSLPENFDNQNIKEIYYDFDINNLMSFLEKNMGNYNEKI